MTGCDRTAAARAGRPDEAGVTLAELIVVIVIMGIVMTVLTSTVMFGLGRSVDADVGLREANAAELTARYFVGDVQSAQAFDAPGDRCGGGGVLTIGADTAGGDRRVVVYRVVRGSDGAWTLERQACEGGRTIALNVLSERVAGRDGVSASCPAPDAPCTLTLEQVGSPTRGIDPFDVELTAVPRAG